MLHNNCGHADAGMGVGVVVRGRGALPIASLRGLCLWVRVPAFRHRFRVGCHAGRLLPTGALHGIRVGGSRRGSLSVRSSRIRVSLRAFAVAAERVVLAEGAAAHRVLLVHEPALHAGAVEGVSAGEDGELRGEFTPARLIPGVAVVGAAPRLLHVRRRRLHERQQVVEADGALLPLQGCAPVRRQAQRLHGPVHRLCECQPGRLQLLVAFGLLLCGGVRAEGGREDAPDDELHAALGAHVKPPCSSGCLRSAPHHNHDRDHESGRKRDRQNRPHGYATLAGKGVLKVEGKWSILGGLED
mmetsp:Transcript_754/g.2115  ORF Transcript_754/g.2115 Transcript_754/m.2115 type:complete len:300 (+) Transcript_754:119-1018(+)